MNIMYNRLRIRQKGLIGELNFSEDMSFTDLARTQIGYLQWYKAHRISFGAWTSQSVVMLLKGATGIIT